MLFCCVCKLYSVSYSVQLPKLVLNVSNTATYRELRSTTEYYDFTLKCFVVEKLDLNVSADVDAYSLLQYINITVCPTIRSIIFALYSQATLFTCSLICYEATGRPKASKSKDDQNEMENILAEQLTTI